MQCVTAMACRKMIHNLLQMWPAQTMTHDGGMNGSAMHYENILQAMEAAIRRGDFAKVWHKYTAILHPTHWHWLPVSGGRLTTQQLPWTRDWWYMFIMKSYLSNGQHRNLFVCQASSSIRRNKAWIWDAWHNLDHVYWKSACHLQIVGSRIVLWSLLAQFL